MSPALDTPHSQELSASKPPLASSSGKEIQPASSSLKRSDYVSAVVAITSFGSTPIFCTSVSLQPVVEMAINVTSNIPELAKLLPA